nr:MAG TPA: hypothetical protein [Caudoviricetes sp.]
MHIQNFVHRELHKLIINPHNNGNESICNL